VNESVVATLAYVSVALMFGTFVPLIAGARGRDEMPDFAAGAGCALTLAGMTGLVVTFIVWAILHVRIA